MGEPKKMQSSVESVARSLFARLAKYEIDFVAVDRFTLVEIHVKGASLNPLDADVAGVYVVEVDPIVPIEQVPYTALDAFNFTVRIEDMDAFEFSVRMDGSVLKTDPAYVTVECFEDEAVVDAILVGKVS